MMPANERLAELHKAYRDELLRDVIPFWLRHGPDREHGGMLTALARDGAVIDTDKALWLQGRAAWMFSTLYNTVAREGEWLAPARSCLGFIENHGRGAGGKLYFQVTREGRPLRMRRYYFSECFAAMGNAAAARATGDERLAAAALDYFARFLAGAGIAGADMERGRPARRGADGPSAFHVAGVGVGEPAFPGKVDGATRPALALAPRMMAVCIAQEIRENLGDREVAGATCTEWARRAIDEIERLFWKPAGAGGGALLENIAPDGAVIDHFDGRTLNPGHAIECAWFILREARHRAAAATAADARLLRLGLDILDAMWARGWDAEHGGLFSFTDLRGLPVQEYVAEMKFWWPHNEAEIAALLAWQLTRDPKYAAMHARVRAYARRVFADPEFGEWFGYAHRDGSIATRLKGNMWKGAFHVPRMLHRCAQITGELLREPERAQRA